MFYNSLYTGFCWFIGTGSGRARMALAIVCVVCLLLIWLCIHSYVFNFIYGALCICTQVITKNSMCLVSVLKR